MGRANAVAHDPSVADYRATSPASPGRNSHPQSDSAYSAAIERPIVMPRSASTI